jgi:hypothetical protein
MTALMTSRESCAHNYLVTLGHIRPIFRGELFFYKSMATSGTGLYREAAGE